jgi:peptide/nickel transport system substrate-binding protein
MEVGSAPTVGGRWDRGNRGLGTVMAAIVMVVVLVAVGAGSYLSFAGVKSGGGSPTKITPPPLCSPPTSQICASLSGGHDIILNVPYKFSTAGTNIPFTAAYFGSGKVSYFLYDYGDGSAVNNTTSTTTHHTYLTAGTYIASVQARVNGAGALHDSWRSLLIVTVIPNQAGSSSFEVPVISGVIAKNSSTSVNPTAILASTSGTVTFNGSYNSKPTDPLSTPLAPTLTVPTNGKVSAVSNGGSYVNETYTFSAPGSYVVTMIGGGTVGSSTFFENYTWTVFVAGAGFSPGVLKGAPPTLSKHAGSLQFYELVGGAARTTDPAINYDTQGGEIISNIFQPLVQYNQSQTGASYVSYVPGLATCVPGSPMCQSMYGSSLISADGFNWTFVVSPTAQFYDPAKGTHWGVYPSDVMFSVARTLGFTTGIAIGATAGWIISQALMHRGNGTWDSLHGAFNNTPSQVLTSMTVNDSVNCPTSAMAAGQHGCITFHANGGGSTWPYFMEFIADGQGQGIAPCGYYSAQGQGIPGWTQGVSAYMGDHPCTLPGGATSTDQVAFTTAVNSMAPKSWDSWEKANAQPISNTQYFPVGSGPYYMKQFVGAAGYLLAANPAYVAPCSWKGCEPAPGTYASSVSVTWESSATPGEQAYKAGISDASSVPQTDIALLLSLVNGGSVSLLSFPTISIYFFPMDLNFDATAARTIVPNANVPSTTLSNVAVRQFLVHAYPYNTVENTINQVDGLTYGLNYGGAIPLSMQFTQQNVSWPAGDPSGSTPGTAAWWWAQLTTASSPYFDSQLSGCSKASPCILPLIGATAAPTIDESMALWAQQVTSISGGAFQLGTADINFGTAVGYSTASPPGQNPMPLFFLGWAPDYPDATDYVNPMYTPDATYTYSDAVAEQLTNVTQGYDSPSCHSATDYNWWAVQAKTPGGVPENCQGSAFNAMNTALAAAAIDLNVTSRNLLYWAAESIANGLALYQYMYQANDVGSYASYLLGSSFNENVTLGGGSENVFYQIQYAATGNGATD